MSRDAEVLILGGGCAGLSLATAIARRAPRMRVLTLEARSAYTRDRTWCFWNSTDHPFQAGVTHRWHQWRVQANGIEARQQSSRFCYQHLPADRFYHMAQCEIAGANQELLMQTEATAVRGSEAGFMTETSQGLVRSRWVFDARTCELNVSQPAFLQRFEGWHVRTEKSCFNPRCVDLMDFQPCTVAGRTVFFYVLPFSEREALIEITYLDPPHLTPECASDRLFNRMSQLCPAGEYEILYKEAGSLPMGTVRRARQHATAAIPLGARGGRIKASSGYAFQRIQTQSALLADALAKGDALPRQSEPRYYGWLDRVFLTALRRNPSRTPDYFLQLFRAVPPDALIPFLSETASPRDLLVTMLALPRRDFIEAAAHTLGAAQ